MNGKFSVLLGIAILIHSSVDGQFYAPATEFHDPAQRFFVVEAARVLAWRAGPDSKIVEIKFEVTTRPDQSTVWEIRWLDAQGANWPVSSQITGKNVAVPTMLMI